MLATKRVYLDTSAYLAVLLGESQANRLLKQLKDCSLCSSTLLLLEAERNLIHLVRQSHLSQRDYDLAIRQLREDSMVFILKDFTPDLCLGLDFPPVRTPRSLDLAHLRTAKWFLENGGLNHFVSLDDDQLKAAAEFGFDRGLLE